MEKTQKIALITGGSRGLGRSMALHLADQGVDVLFTYNSNVKAAEEVLDLIKKKGRKAAALQLDTSKVAGFANFVAQMSQTLQKTWNVANFNFLVNNAGTGMYVPFTEMSEAQFDEILNIHFKGVFFLTQKLLPLIQDGGRIINISSGLARFSFPGSSAYAAMKGAVEVLSRYLALELGPRRITVNVIAPGAIATDFGGGHVRDTPDLNKQLATQTALGRVGLPDDVGGAVALILSDGANWINGQRIEVSGGFLL